MLKKKSENEIKTKKSYSAKVKLTDLCPEEKSKIGKLVTALEERNKEIEELENQIG